MAMHFRGQNDPTLRDRIRAWVRRTWRTPGAYALAVGVDKRTARRRFDADDPRDPPLEEIERLGRLRPDFIRDVLLPAFETPDDELERRIAEHRMELARLEAARRARRAGPAGLDDEG